ncbi:hypothetical protein V500_05312 [Pseudogymnoascus sp. VKM F-4518 (FW-2643)]|nr:hypothetical protein V500_05312 [Pseudogymnoascus sp. VKM F-4518 (FW-2643)]
MDDRTLSPYFDTVMDGLTLPRGTSQANQIVNNSQDSESFSSQLNGESTTDISCDNCGVPVWTATATMKEPNTSTYSDDILSSTAHDNPSDLPDCEDYMDIDDLVADGSYRSRSYDQFIDDFYEEISPSNTDILPARTMRDKVEKATTQGDVEVSVSTNFPTATSLCDSPTPYLRCTGLHCSDPISPTLSPWSTRDDFIPEFSMSDCNKGYSCSSYQSEYDQSESESSDCDSIDTDSKTHPAFDPVKRALFSYSTRQFWIIYNRLSRSNWTALQLKHAIYVGAASSSEETGKSTYTTSDTSTPPKCLSNATPLAQKRKMRDDEDEDDANNGERSLRRRNKTLPQKEGLDFACPFHKYKPWRYNHNFRRFKTCSTTAFNTIFRLREHLRRVHPAPIYCLRCCQHFTDQNSLLDHARADPCPTRPIVAVEGWTTEMGARVKKRETETERECWERIYRELFGRTLIDIPSPYFVPYSLTTPNEAELENLLLHEVPQRVLNSLREDVNSLDVADAARALFDASAPHLQIENRIRSAIRELCAEYRSSIATSNNSGAPCTPQSLPENHFIVSGREPAQSTTSQSTDKGSLQSAQHPSEAESSLSAAPPGSTETMQHSNSIMQPSALDESSYTEDIPGQDPALTGDVLPHTSGTVSENLPPYYPDQFQNAQQYIQQVGLDVANAYGTSMDEYVLSDFDFQVDFADDTFLHENLDL